MTELKRHEIQGVVLSSYGHLPCATYLLLRVTNPQAGRRWLGETAGKITTAEGRQEDSSLNIAFTSTGLSKMGFSADDISKFSRPFQEGMATGRRAKTLSDVDEDDPKNWLWGNPDNPVDILLAVFASDEVMLDRQLKERRDEIETFGGIQEVIALSAGRQPDTKEHFGFLDGVGQPVIEGSGSKASQLERTGHATVVQAGEFILGYKNALDVLDAVPGMTEMPNFGADGTYLVFRQMAQDVTAFWTFLDEATRLRDGTSDVAAREKLGAKFIGRWKSGAPITKYPDRDPYPETPKVSGEKEAPKVNRENDFEYAENDEKGFGCPVGAHIRRANPRDSLPPDPKTALQSAKRHRIMRRGRSYGDRTENAFVEDGKERGLHFICLNSDIERQFEFIQQTWINNKKFAGLYDEADPLIGRHKPDNLFTVQSDPLRIRIHNLRKFVTVKGGGYFFMPGISALKYIAERENS